MLVSGSYHNKIVYYSLITGMSQVVILSVLGVELVDIGGVCVVEQLRRCDSIACQ